MDKYLIKAYTTKKWEIVPFILIINVPSECNDVDKFIYDRVKKYTEDKFIEVKVIHSYKIEDIKFDNNLYVIENAVIE